MRDKRFFILWNPLSDLPPRVRFATAAMARKVAEAMASRTGQSFYLCEVQYRSARGPAKTSKLR
jgi:hypothetical protein